MNRIEQFGNHHVHTVLNTLNENIKIYPTDDLEVARIKKIISYIKQYLQLIDPELLNDTHITQLAQIQAQINNCIAYINQESKTQSVKHIEIAISHVLTLPITVKTAKQSIVGIMRAYNDSIKEGLEQIDLESTKQSAEKIKELEQKIFTSYEDEKGVDDLIDEKYKCIKDSHTKINKYYNELLVDEDCIQDEIKIAKDKILETKDKIDEEAENFEEKLIEFKKYYKKVFGFENEDSEITIGLKEELEKRKEQLDSLEKNYKDKLEEIESGHKAKYESLQNEIKSLLPDATSAGLATAYVAESVKFDDAIKVWNGVFIFSIIIMCVMYSLLSYYSVSQEKTSLNIMVSFIIRLPYLLPFIWLGFYAGKRRNESARLKHEYIHKATLAKSYSSYKTQIDELQDDNNDLLKQLLESSIETIGYNPSQTLDKNHNDKTPITELIRLTVEKTTELVKNKKESSKEK